MDISVTALRAASTRLAVSANNVANVLTPDFKASRATTEELPTGRGVMVNVMETDSGTDLSTEMVDQLITLRYAQANGSIVRRGSEMLGELINMFA